MVKNGQKSAFFLKASEKRVVYVLFLNRTLCDLKVLPNFFLSACRNFCPLYEVVLGGWGNPMPLVIFLESRFHSKYRQASKKNNVLGNFFCALKKWVKSCNFRQKSFFLVVKNRVFGKKKYFKIYFFVQKPYFSRQKKISPPKNYMFPPPTITTF